MTTALGTRPSFALPHPVVVDRYVTSFSVDVVDGNGLEVASQAVTVRYGYPDGTETARTVRTDGGGRARLVDEHTQPPESVTLASGRETIRDIRPNPGSIVTIET